LFPLFPVFSPVITVLSVLTLSPELFSRFIIAPHHIVHVYPHQLLEIGGVFDYHLHAPIKNTRLVREKVLQDELKTGCLVDEKGQPRVRDRIRQGVSNINKADHTQLQFEVGLSLC